MYLSIPSAFVLAYITVALGAPVPVQDLDRRASDLEARAPVHWMNIRLHHLDEPKVRPGEQSTMNLAGHNLWLRELEEEEEEEFERDFFNTKRFRIGTVILN